MPTELEDLEWRDFEQLVAMLFTRLGYEARVVGGKRDHGADVVASKGSESVAIQVKHRSTRKWVGERAVQGVVTAAPMYGCNRRLVVTNSTFAPSVEEVAAVHDVELWDGDRLRQELMSFCTICDVHVSSKVRDWCLERTDEFGGKVYCFVHQRRLRGVLRTAPRDS